MTPDELSSFLSAHPGWSGDATAIKRTYEFGAYAPAVGFAMAVALTAEKRDHHPDLLITWGKVEVRWTTHDAGGTSQLDIELAQASDALFHP